MTNQMSQVRVTDVDEMQWIGHVFLHYRLLGSVDLSMRARYDPGYRRSPRSQSAAVVSFKDRSSLRTSVPNEGPPFPMAFRAFIVQMSSCTV